MALTQSPVSLLATVQAKRNPYLSHPISPPATYFRVIIFPMTLSYRLSVLCLTLLLGTGGLASQGIEFFHGTWAEALEKAEAEDKLIFVDAYASWCGPCKRMAAQVFPQEQVGTFFNQNFINMKFDMEKAEAKDFKRKHSVRAYPTLFFINGKNEVVHTTVGGKSVDRLIGEGRNAVMKMDNVEDLAARWETDEHTPKLALKYIRAMVRQGENHAKVANDYLRDQTDLDTPENLDILLVAATDADSRIFDLMVENKEAIIARSGQDAFDAQVKTAVLATKDKALEFKDAGLLKTAVDKYARVDADASKVLELRGEFEMAAAGTDGKDFYKATKKYLAKGAEGDATQLRLIYNTTSKSTFISDDKVLDLAVEAGAQLAELQPKDAYRTYYDLAKLLNERGRGDEALRYANEALASTEALPAGRAKSVRKAIEDLIGKIESAR